MNEALLLFSVGLRASITLAALIVVALYYNWASAFLLELLHGGGWPEPRRENAAAIFVAGASFAVFVGKRVVNAVVFNTRLGFDIGVWDQIGTCLGLSLGVLSLTMFAHAKLKYIGRPELAYAAVAVTLLGGGGFAVFYGVLHRIM